MSQAYSRRSLIQGSLASAALFAATFKSKIASAQSASNPCLVGFDHAAYTLNGQAIATTATATSADLASQHQIVANFYQTTVYANAATTLESTPRSVLTVDVGPSPLAAVPVFHPMDIQSSGFTSDHSITDLYVFNQADNSLLFWKKVGATEPYPSAMFTLSPAMLKMKVTIVARCSVHGYWGLEQDLTGTPAAYSTAVAAANLGDICAGATIARPFTSHDATGGQGDMGVLHRPNVIQASNSSITICLGGTDAAGDGRHPIFTGGLPHYVMGGMLYDQSSNIIGQPQVIRNSDAQTQQLTFSGLDLQGQNVTTIRSVMFDTYQGRFMGFYDVA